jgi:predicted acyl esterase
VHELRNVWIPLSDGARLSARIWLPQDAEDDPSDVAVAIDAARPSVDRDVMEGEGSSMK